MADPSDVPPGFEPESSSSPAAASAPPPAGDLPPGFEPEQAAPAGAPPAAAGPVVPPEGEDPEAAAIRAQFTPGTPEAEPLRNRLRAFMRAGGPGAADPAQYFFGKEFEEYQATRGTEDDLRRAALLRWRAKNGQLAPEQAARVLKLSAATGYHVDWVAQNLEAVQKQVDEKGMDWEDLARNHGALADFLLEDPARFHLVADAAKDFTGIDRAIGRFDRAPDSFLGLNWTRPVWMDKVARGVTKNQEQVIRQTTAALDAAAPPDLSTLAQRQAAWEAGGRKGESPEAEYARVLSAGGPAPLTDAAPLGARFARFVFGNPLGPTEDEKRWAYNVQAGEILSEIRSIDQNPMVAAPGRRAALEAQLRAIEPYTTAGLVRQNLEALERLKTEVTGARDYGDFSRTLLGRVAYAGPDMAAFLGGNVAAAALAGPAGAFAFNFGQVYGPSAYELQATTGKDGKPIDPKVALAMAAADATVQSAVQLVPLQNIVAKIPGAEALVHAGGEAALTRALVHPRASQVLLDLLKESGIHVASGAAAMAVSAGHHRAVVELTKMAADPSYRPDMGAAWDAAGEAGAQAVIDLAPVVLVPAFARLAGDIGRTRAAQQSARRVRQVLDQAQQPEFQKLVEAAPQEARRLLQAMVEAQGPNGGVTDTVHVDLEAFTKHFRDQGLDPRTVLDQVMDGGGAAYDRAVDQKAERLAIPLPDFAAKFASGRLAQSAVALFPDTTTGADIPTPRQLDAEAKLRAKKAKEYAKVEPDKMELDQRQVYDDFMAQALEAGEDEKSADAAARIYSAGLKVLAERAGRGETAFDLWQAHPLNIHGKLGKDQLAHLHLQDAFQDYDRTPAGKAHAFLRGDVPEGLQDLAAAHQERAAGAGGAVVPHEVRKRLAAAQRELAAVEGAGATRQVRVRVESDPEGGGRVALDAGGDRAVRLPAWLKPEDFAQDRATWEWTWSALKDGPATPEPLQRAVADFMRRGNEGFPPNEFALKQGYALARLIEGKGGKKFAPIRERLLEWAKEPEATRGPVPVPEQAWGALIDTARKDVDLESTSRGYMRKVKREAMDRWLAQTRAELDTARATYAERPPRWYEQPAGEAPAPDEGRAAALRAEIEALNARAKTEAKVKPPALDWKAATEILGKDAEKLPTAENGLHPDDLARAVGAPSGDQLLRDMLGMKDRSGWAREQARARMAAGAQPRPRGAAGEIPRASRELTERFHGLKPEERAREFYADRNTGILNEIALRDLPPDPARPMLGHISVEGTKWVQDHPDTGHQKGDLLYRMAGKALHDVVTEEGAGFDPHAFKVGGDFVVRVKDQAELDRIVERLNERMPVKGFEATGAAAGTLDAAHDQHVTVKERLEAGPTPKRAKRGEKPFGVQAESPVDVTLPEEQAAHQLPAALAERHAGLGDREAFRAAYVEPGTGALTATGYAALAPKAHRASIDLDGLKFLNDKLGRKQVDTILRAFGRLAMREGGGEFDFAHLHGDEYAAQSDDLGALQRFVERVQSVSDKVRWRVTAQDGTVKELQGVQFGHGIGESNGAAERSLQDGKRARAAAGLRGPEADLRRLADPGQGRDVAGRGEAGGHGGAGPLGRGARGQDYAGAPDALRRAAQGALEQPAYHGTRARNIDRFSLQFMGTGEGAQAFGWGLYFAERKGIAEGYRTALAKPEVTLDGKPIDEAIPDLDEAIAADRVLARLQRYAEEENLPIARVWDKVKRLTLQDLQDADAEVATRNDDLVRMEDEAKAEGRDPEGDADYRAAKREGVAALERANDMRRRAEFLEKTDPARVKVVQGQTYRVDLPEKHELLDYDKPLSLQEPAILEKLRAAKILPPAEVQARYRAAREAELDFAKPEEGAARNLLGHMAGLLEGGGGEMGPEQPLSVSVDKIRKFYQENLRELEEVQQKRAGAMGNDYLRKDLAGYRRALEFIDEVEKDPSKLDPYRERFRAEREANDLEKEWGSGLLAMDPDKVTGANLQDMLARETDDGSPRGASERLRAAGIPGLKFLDQPSRKLESKVLFDGRPTSAFDWTTLSRPEQDALNAIDNVAHAQEAKSLDEVRRRAAAWIKGNQEALDALERLMPRVTLRRPRETHNFVIWDENRITITGRLYQAARKKAAQDAAKNLLVQHNLSGENLVHADELGGLAVPSLAIARAEHPLTGFGEVTLLAPSELADPAKVPVFDADVYSPRWPDTGWTLKKGGAKAFREALGEDAAKVGLYLGDIENELSKEGPEGMRAKRDVQAALALKWLREQGKPIADIMEPVPGELTDVLKQPSMRRFVEERGLDRNPIEGEAYHRDLTDAYKRAVEELAGSAGDEDIANNLREIYLNHIPLFGAREDFWSRFDETSGLLRSNDMDKVLLELAHFGEQRIDTSAMADAANKAVGAAMMDPRVAAEFDAWAMKQLRPLFGDQFIKRWTESGNVRRIPYTLENVVREMTRKGIRGEEGGAFGGLGQVRSKGAKKYRTLVEVQADRGKIVDDRTMDAEKTRLNDRFFALVDKVRQYHATAGDADAFRIPDALASALGESLKRGRSLSVELGKDGFRDVPPELVQEISDFGRELLAAPTHYLEAKPQRGVGIPEFTAAVIPDTASAEVRAVLKKHGVDVVEYPKGDEIARQKAIAAAAARHQLLFQEGQVEARMNLEQGKGKDKGARGFIDFTPLDGGERVRMDIHLLNSDPSTLAHESFHALAKVMQLVAGRGDAPPELRAEHEKLAQAMGYKDAAERAEHPSAEKEERASHLFEMYLAEGKAPAEDLLVPFARLRAWMKRIYQKTYGSAGEGIAAQYRAQFGKDIALSDDVRALFARMLAGDAAVADAARDVVSEVPAAPLTPEERAESYRLRDQARAAAEAALQRQILEEERKTDRAFMGRARAKAEADVRAELEQSNKAFGAAAALERGEIDGMPVKLDRASVKAALGPEVAKQIPREMMGDEGLHPDAAAQLLGFDSGAEMVRQILNQDRDAMVKAATDQRMAELYPKLQDRPGLLREYAKQDLDNDALLRDGLLRMRAIAREAGLPTPKLDAESLRAAVEQAIGERAIKDLEPGKYDAASRGFARKAAELKDPQKRLDAFEAYLFNRAMAKAAVDARKQGEKTAKALQRYTTDARRNEIGKATEQVKNPDTGEVVEVRQPYLETLDGLLGAFEFGNTSMREVGTRDVQRAALEKWVNERRADGDDVIIPPSVLEKLERTTHWKDLTVKELQDLKTAADSIAQQAKLRTLFKIGGEKVETSKLIDQLVAEARENGARVRLHLTGDPTRLEKVQELGRYFFGGFRQPEALFDRLGPTWAKAIFGTISDAAYRYHDLVRDSNKAIQDELRALSRADRARLKQTYRTKDGMEFTGEEAIGALLNCGSESNLSKMLRGMSNPELMKQNRGLKTWNGRGTLDEILQVLTQRDVDLVNRIHATLESRWEAMSNLEKETTGAAPEKVPPRRFRFVGQGGQVLEIAGGYYPLIANRAFRVGKGQAAADAASQNGLPGLFFSGYERAMTPQGHLRERVESVAYPLDLHLDALPRHLVKESKDLAFRMDAKQTYRLLTDPRIMGALNEALGEHGYDTVVKWLTDSVNDVMLPMDSSNWALDQFRHLRNAAYRSTFALNIPQTLQNWADSAGIAAVMPPKFYAKAALDFARDLGAHHDVWVRGGEIKSERIQAILDESGEMRLRLEGLRGGSLMKDLESTFRRSELGLGFEAVQDLMVRPFEVTQLMTELPTYAGAKEHALAPKEKGGLGLDEAAAVKHAEAMVRRMFGGKRTTDLTPIQRNVVLKHFTMFWGWAAAQLNKAMRATSQAGQEWTQGQRLRAVRTVVGSFANLWAIALASALLTGKGPKDEDEDGLDAKDVGGWAWHGGWTFPLTTLPMVGSVVRAATGDQPTRDVSLTPWTRPLSAFLQAKNATAAAMGEDADEDQELDAALQWLAVVGQFTGMPVNQARRTARYWMSEERTGQESPLEDLLGTAFGPPQE